jgi:hypothetical protein
MNYKLQKKLFKIVAICSNIAPKSVRPHIDHYMDDIHKKIVHNFYQIMVTSFIDHAL